MAQGKPKVVMFFPPLDTSKGFPTVSGNRQFQYFKSPTYIYPIIPAQLATQLRNNGKEVLWLDCLAGKHSMHEMEEFKPDAIFMETKAPIHHEIMKWKEDLHLRFPKASIHIYGDHAKQLGMDPIDYKNLGHEIDRGLTQWELYAYANGNFKRTPGTYIMSARDCWWGKCTFCSWAHYFDNYQCREVEDVLDEIEELVIAYDIKEIMDDAGTFPKGEWLKDFCSGMVDRGLHKEVSINCNVRFGYLGKSAYKDMKKAGFRMVLYGLESANQITLDRINKGVKLSHVKEELKIATGEGLFTHVSVMYGFPWESLLQAHNTYFFLEELINEGFIYTVQASTVVPYPGTKMAHNAFDFNWLETFDWTKYDMTQPVMKCNYNPQELVNDTYKLLTSPQAIWHKLKRIRDIADVKYLWRGYNKMKGHIK